MAKVQGKKSAAGKKVAGGKPVARAKSAKPAPKRPAKTVAKKAVKTQKKTAAKAKKATGKVVSKVVKKAAPKPAASPKITAKGATPAKATKPTKSAKPPAPQAKPAKTSTASKTKATANAIVKTVAKVPATTGVTPTRVASPRPAPAEADKKRRRSRPKVSSTGGATANWFTHGDNRPRPSSFIPAPPRAEAPSLVAAPPASSDRLVSHDELTEFVVRTVPVRIEVEAGGGRIFLGITPDNVVLRIGEGIEFDFRYVSGADFSIDELIIEFDKPSPFSQTIFRSRRPGSNRPHRQLSGAVQKTAAGKQISYTVRALNSFKTEMATARPSVTIQQQ